MNYNIIQSKGGGLSFVQHNNKYHQPSMGSEQD
jgi:hypothetical protein